MSILSLVQAVANQLGLDTPSALVGSSDTTAKQLLALAELEGQESRKLNEWPELSKEYTFTLATSTASYALPTDLEKFIFRTEWDRNNHWEMLGPATAQEWQYLKSGLAVSGPRWRFRIKGSTSTQFFFDPTPSSADNGKTMAFEYQSKNWCRPKTWTASTSFSAAKYCWYNGNIYYTTSGGTTGSTAPTHTTGSASDDGVTWIYQDIIYEAFLADTDEILLDEQIFKLGLKWRFLQTKGMAYQPFQKEWMDSIKIKSTELRGARTLSLARRPISLLVNPSMFADSGYGS